MIRQVSGILAANVEAIPFPQQVGMKVDDQQPARYARHPPNTAANLRPNQQWKEADLSYERAPGL